MSGPRATFLSGASSDMKEPPLRTSCGGGSFVLRSAPERKAALLFWFAPCGGDGDVHFCEYSAIEGPCIPTSGKKSGFLDVFYG